jgi:hypothetical protein
MIFPFWEKRYRIGRFFEVEEIKKVKSKKYFVGGCVTISSVSELNVEKCDYEGVAVP